MTALGQQPPKYLFDNSDGYVNDNCQITLRVHHFID